MAQFIPRNKQTAKNHRTTRDSGKYGVFLDETHCNLVDVSQRSYKGIQRDSKRWTQFRTSIFPELYMVFFIFSPCILDMKISLLKSN